MKKTINLNKQIHFLALATIVIISLFLYFTPIQFVEKLTLSFGDYKFQVRQFLEMEPDSNSNLVIVTIDEASVNNLGRWPWNRKDISTILSALNEAHIVGLDMVFSEHTNKESDLLLSETIAQNDNIILGYFFRTNATSSEQEENFEILEECAFHNVEVSNTNTGIQDFPYAETNLAVFHENSLSCGFFSASQEVDGLYRKYPIAYIYQGLLLPSIAVQMIRFSKEEDVKLLLNKNGIAQLNLNGTEIKNQNKIRLNFSNNIKTVSALDVFSGVVPPAYFKDKIVLVGVTELGVFDMRPTPIDSVTPGVYLHYTALSNLIDGNFLSDSRHMDLLLIILAILLISYISTVSRMSIRIPLYFASLILVVITANVMFLQFNFWLQEIYAIFSMLALASLFELSSFHQLGNKTRELKLAFSSYVSPELVSEITRDPTKLLLGGNEKIITVLFSDIRNFTSMSEKLTPTELVTLLNQLFDPLTEVVLRNNGMLDKYIGDAMMVLFNAPLNLDDHPIKAIKTSLAMLEVLRTVNQNFQEKGFPKINIGIGINTGSAVVGNMGSKVRFNYTALGDAVNLAARLEGLTSYYGVKIIISEFTEAMIPIDSDILVRKLDQVQVKGKEESVIIYEVMINNKDNIALKTEFEKARESYLAKQFLKSASLFQKLYEHNNDNPSKIFYQRCLQYQKQPPATDWVGIEKMNKK